MRLIEIAYLLPTLACWRMLAGNFAWRIHTSAQTQRDVKPEIEDWAASAVMAAPLALVWWLVLIFSVAVPSFLKTEVEQESERVATILKAERMRLQSEQMYKALDAGTIPDEVHLGP